MKPVTWSRSSGIRTFHCGCSQERLHCLLTLKTLSAHCQRPLLLRAPHLPEAGSADFVITCLALVFYLALLLAVLGSMFAASIAKTVPLYRCYIAGWEKHGLSPEELGVTSSPARCWFCGLGPMKLLPCWKEGGSKNFPPRSACASLDQINVSGACPPQAPCVCAR